MELEYEECDVNFKPQNLLGENSGKRGSGQTSPDLAIKFKTADERKGIILFESKFTEESFYVCSGYKKRANDDKLINPDRNRCLNTTALVNSNFCECHLTNWHRRYWDLLEVELNKDGKPESNKAAIEHEIGDALFSLCQLSRWNGLRAEDCLKLACERFTKRFSHMEKSAGNRHLTEIELSEFDDLWNEAKKAV